MLTLNDIIGSKENLEMKRALAVKMILLDFRTEDICAVLDVSDSFVSNGRSLMKIKEHLRYNFIIKEVPDF